MGTIAIPGLVAGTWSLDAAHSEVGFVVRHMMVTKVRGTFQRFEGAIEIAPDPLQSTVTVTIDVTSINTDNADRDAHLRSADYFESEKFPSMTYRSTRVRDDGGDVLVDGDLTLHGVTKPVTLNVEVNGVQKDPWGGTRVGLSAEGELSRRDFGIDINMPLDGGGVVVGDKIKLVLELQAVLQTPAS